MVRQLVDAGAQVVVGDEDADQTPIALAQAALRGVRGCHTLANRYQAVIACLTDSSPGPAN